MESHEQNSNFCELDNGTLQRLSDLVARAHARTSATGVAIAIVQADELITCAASGPSAPEAGTRAPIAGSFSGRCASSGEMLTCEDVTKDDRVNGEGCAAMGIFSMVMVPISENKHTRGVLAAFSDRPNSFSPSQLTVLNTFAEIANELLQHRDQASSGEAPTPVGSITDPSAKCETVLHDVLSAYEKERRANQAGRTNVTPFPEPSKSEPRTPFVVTSPPGTSVSPAATTAPTAPAARESGRPSVATESKFATERTTEKFKPQPVRPMSTAGGAATKMAVIPEISARQEPAKPKDDSDLLSFAADPMPMKIKKAAPVIGNARAERVSAAEDAALFSSLTDQHTKSGSPMKFVVGAVVVLVLAGGVFGFSRMSHHTATVSAATPAVETSSSAPAPEVSSQPTTPAPAPSITEEPSATKELPKVTEESHRREDVKPVEEHKQTPTPQETEPRFVKSAGAPVQKSPMPEVQAPLVAGLAASRMPEMKATVVPPKPDFPTASVTAPKLINGPRPIFPAAANAMHLTSDTVVLNAKVMTNGKIGDISVVRGHPVFVEAVKEAVKHWQYTPAQLNHQPTESTIEIVFKFGQGS
jgi:TonB family protein